MSEIEKIHLSFYRFVRLGGHERLAKLRVQVRAFCDDLQLTGTVLLSHEGVNAMVTGTRESIDALRIYTAREFGVQDKDFKEAQVPDDSFNRMLVKIKKEIITVGDPELMPDEHTAPRLSPAELKKWLDEKRQMVLLDTRNQYEIGVGTFEGAEPIGIDTSRDFARKAQERFKNGQTDEPIVTFCTGGIRSD
jgi:UPF0176 protein